MDNATPPKYPRVHLVKMEMGASQRYVMESSMMSVIMPGASCLIGADWENTNDGNPHSHISTAVPQDVYDLLPYPEYYEYEVQRKEIDFGNGLKIFVTIDPFAGMTDEEAQEAAKLMHEDEDEEEITEHDLQILEQIFSDPVNEPIRL